MDIRIVLEIRNCDDATDPEKLGRAVEALVEDACRYPVDSFVAIQSPTMKTFAKANGTAVYISSDEV